MTLPALPLGLEQPRKQRAHRQALDVAGVDAGEQRLGQVVDRLLAEAPPHERADRFVVVATRGAASTTSQRHPQLAARA